MNIRLLTAVFSLLLFGQFACAGMMRLGEASAKLDGVQTEGSFLEQGVIRFVDESQERPLRKIGERENAGEFGRISSSGNSVSLTFLPQKLLLLTSSPFVERAFVDNHSLPKSPYREGPIKPPQQEN